MHQKSKRICHIASIDITVGYLLLPQLKFLLRQGYEVCAVCSPGKLVKDIEAQGIRVMPIVITRKLISPIADILAFMKLFLYFKKEKFDLVHTHAPKPGLLGQWAAKLAGVPVVVNTVHGLYFTENSPPLQRRIYIAVEKISALCSTSIFSQNKEDIDTMVRERIAPSRKISYLGNGIDVAKFAAEKYSPEFIRKKKQGLGLPADAIIIGIVGRLVKEKGYGEIFEAMKAVLQKYPHAVLLSAGPSDPEKKDAFSREMAREYGVGNHVIFLGERRDMEELYPLMDVFVLPSYREGFPRSVLEAMAARRPIVVTDIRGCREEIDNGINGLVVPVKNAAKLAEAIISLLENPGLAGRLGDNAVKRAREEFDETAVFTRIKEAYAQLLRP